MRSTIATCVILAADILLGRATVKAPLGEGLPSSVIRVRNIKLPTRLLAASCADGYRRTACASCYHQPACATCFSQASPPAISRAERHQPSRLKRAVWSTTISCIHLPSHGLTSISSTCNQTLPLFSKPSSSRKSIAPASHRAARSGWK